MNAVEIEQAISRLAEAAFNAAEFPYAFLEALAEFLPLDAQNWITCGKALRRERHISPPPSPIYMTPKQCQKTFATHTRVMMKC